jgi:2-phospho-L-lactate/phosphoenolpyruvate guanylyltransferase
MWAVVPLKSPENAKSRLSGVLSPVQRRQLLFTLAERVIRALQATRGINDVAIVTASKEIAAFARRLGAQLILQSAEAGTAAAFAAAIQQLQPLQLQRLLMIAGDLPLVSPAAIEQVIACADSQPGVVVVPDRHRVGTNALLCAPPEVMAPCFGQDSFQLHLRAAETAGIAAHVLEVNELALDLDVADDLEYLRTQGGAAAQQLFQTLKHIDNSVTTLPRRIAGAN